MAIHPLPEEPLPPDLAVDDPPFDLDDLDDDVEQIPEDHPARAWRIDDDGAAEWAMRHLADRRARLQALARQRDDWMERIDRWFAQASRAPGRDADFFEGALADYMRRRREDDPEVKSIPLPSGRLRSTGTGGKPAVTDNDTVVEWVAEHDPGAYDQVVKDEPTVRVSELRKRLRVVEEHVGVEINAELACGHRVVEVWRFDEHDGEDFAGPPTELFCYDCPEDPIDGAPPAVKVETVGTSPAFEQTVIHADLGYPVPGLAVEPAGFNVTVVPELP